MTAPPQVNGHTRPAALPVFGDWRSVEQPEPPTQEQPEVPPTPHVEPQPVAPAVDYIALAEAEAIRKRADAEAEALRIKAEGEAAAAVAKAEAEAEKLRLANERAAMAAQEKRADHELRMAEVNRKREEIERQAAEARKAEEVQQAASTASAKEIASAENDWKFFAIAFAVACGIVALPVQMSAFWHPDRPWMISAPFMLEGGAWVVLRGAAAAVAARRPHWHFRLIAWFLAFVAAGINLWHGLEAFDLATALGTAFASLAGPGVWDLHEHGRIRKRDAVLSRRERKAAKKATKKKKVAQAAQEQREAAREEARQKAMEAINTRLAQQRAAEFPDEWKYATKLAVAMGETTVTEKVWERAFDVMHASKPSETAAEIRLRNAALRRVEAARSEAPGNRPVKVTNGQRVIQTPRSSYKPVPPVRKPKDTPPYHRAAGRAHSDLLRRSNAIKPTTEEQK